MSAPLVIRATKAQLVALGEIGAELSDPDDGAAPDGRYSVVLLSDGVLSIADVERTYYIAEDGGPR